MKKKPPTPLPTEEQIEPQDHDAKQSEAQILEYWNAQKQLEAVPLPLPEVAPTDDTTRSQQEPRE